MFDHEDGGSTFLRNVILYGLTSHKIVLFHSCASVTFYKNKCRQKYPISVTRKVLRRRLLHLHQHANADRTAICTKRRWGTLETFFGERTTPKYQLKRTLHCRLLPQFTVPTSNYYQIPFNIRSERIAGVSHLYKNLRVFFLARLC
jgi:hypothetical protein